jgi:hypothetical protein
MKSRGFFFFRARVRARVRARSSSFLKRESNLSSHRDFPIFHSHLDLAHHYWERLLQKGDWANILLEKRPQGGVIGIDIQQVAISRTNDLLRLHFSEEDRARIHLYCQSHTDFPPLAQKNPIRLIVYNLGYLPKGNKQMTTMTQNTLISVGNALDLVVPGGAVSITCYPGHEEGLREEKAVLEEVSNLCSATWNVCTHTFSNRPLAPSLIFIQRTRKIF